jgi:prevent-host-death family protein
MKKLSELQVLAGEHEVITLTTFRRSPGEVVMQVQHGKSFTLTQRGKKIAELTPHRVEAEQETAVA